MSDPLLTHLPTPVPLVSSDSLSDQPASAAPKPKVTEEAAQSAATTDDAPPDPNSLRSSFENGDYPYETRMGRRSYEAQKAHLQAELLKVQLWAQETGQKIVLLFEGRDAAGKGGTIKRFTEHLNPRTARVVALNKPTDQERGQWYFQRYVQHLPPPVTSCSRIALGITARASSG